MFATVDYDPEEHPECHAGLYGFLANATRAADFWGLRPRDVAPSHSVRLFAGECAWDHGPKMDAPSHPLVVVEYDAGLEPLPISRAHHRGSDLEGASAWAACIGQPFPLGTSMDKTRSVRLFLGELPWTLEP